MTYPLSDISMRSRNTTKRRFNVVHYLKIMIFGGALSFSFAMTSSFAFAQAEAPSLGGRLETEINGRTLSLPLLKSDYKVRIEGDLAHVTLTQTFENPSKQPLHARYLFPLHREAAVNAMTLRVGDEQIEAVIQEKKQAQKTFEAAKAKGAGAALLTQHRPNMFTQDVANMMPGLPVTVTLQYVHALPRKDSLYRLVLPLAVGPRYQPTGQKTPLSLVGGRDQGITPAIQDDLILDELQDHAEGQWQFDPAPSLSQDIAGLTQPESLTEERVSISIDLDGGMEIQAIDSPTHALAIHPEGSGKRRITLDDNRVIDNRDFELRYRLASDETAIGLTAMATEEDGYLSLLIEPPLAPETQPIMAREVVFLLDCSGSMSGAPMMASKAFMREALKALRPHDSFRIIRFSDRATEFSQTPLPATANNIAKGLTYTERLQGSGGTEMMSGVRQALEAPIPQGSMRLVVFLTDGYIGNEADVLRVVEQEKGDARLYSLGVGSGTNRYLLEELSRVGKSTVRFLDPTEGHEALIAQSKDLANRINLPVMTDLAIHWGDLKIKELYPTTLPDVFAGDSLRVMARYEGEGPQDITVTGHLAARNGRLTLNANLPAAPRKQAAAATEQDLKTSALPAMFARKAIADHMFALISPRDRRAHDLSDAELREKVTALGLQHHLVTQWTSFVAVTKAVLNPEPATTDTVSVPNSKIAGTEKEAYETRTPVPLQKEAQHATTLRAKTQIAQATPAGSAELSPYRFAGAPAPEPESWAALLLMTLLGGWAFARKKRSHKKAF